MTTDLTTEGRLEVLPDNETWRGVSSCGNAIINVMGELLCNQLGYGFGSAIVSESYTSDAETIHLSAIHCGCGCGLKETYDIREIKVCIVEVWNQKSPPCFGFIMLW